MHSQKYVFSSKMSPSRYLVPGGSIYYTPIQLIRVGITGRRVWKAWMTLVPRGMGRWFDHWYKGLSARGKNNVWMLSSLKPKAALKI